MSQRSFAGRQNIDLSTRSLASWLLPFDGVVWRSIYRWNRVRGRELCVCSTRVWNPIRAVQLCKPTLQTCAALPWMRATTRVDKLSIIRIVTSASVPGSRLDSDRLLLLQYRWIPGVGDGGLDPDSESPSSFLTLLPYSSVCCVYLPLLLLLQPLACSVYPYSACQSKYL